MQQRHSLDGSQLVSQLRAWARDLGLSQIGVAEVDLRSAPRLVFRADPPFDTASRIDNLLRKPDVARDLVAMDDVDDGEPTPENGHGA